MLPEKSRLFRATLISSLIILVTFETNAFAIGEEGGLDLASASISAPSLQLDRKLPAGTVIALNHDTNLNGKLIPKGSELIVDSESDLAMVDVDEKGLAKEDLIYIGSKVEDLADDSYTVLDQDESTGEIEAYNIPDDFELSGPGGGHHRRGGVTNCYHVVKALVHRRITLTGVPAYEAAPQLRAAGWHRYASYSAAPRGSICVFAAGGKVTSSGGQRYGHIGVKGAGGIANPESGFKLRRPFLGCWNER